MMVCPEEFKDCGDVSNTLQEQSPMVVCSRELMETNLNPDDDVSKRAH